MEMATGTSTAVDRHRCVCVSQHPPHKERKERRSNRRTVTPVEGEGEEWEERAEAGEQATERQREAERLESEEEFKIGRGRGGEKPPQRITGAYPQQEKESASLHASTRRQAAPLCCRDRSTNNNTKASR